MQMPINEFKRSLLSGKPQIGIWSTLPYPLVSELVGGAGYDWVLLDAEHTATDVPQMLGQLQALGAATPCRGRAPSAPVVRPPWNDPVLLKRYLDIGAQNFLLPFVQSAEEAQDAVRSVSYPPRGTRGLGGSTRASNFGRISDYANVANDEICTLVQVESGSALAQIEEIAAVPGVDGIFVGPADLSASLGYVGRPTHPEVEDLICDAIGRIRRAGKAPGIVVTEEHRARKYLEAGALFVAVGVDTVMLRNALDSTATKFDRGPLPTDVSMHQTKAQSC
jgi:4-hydroxy-2-oxoheptanedioate aldolase